MIPPFIGIGRVMPATGMWSERKDESDGYEGGPRLVRLVKWGREARSPSSLTYIYRSPPSAHSSLSLSHTFRPILEAMTKQPKPKRPKPKRSDDCRSEVLQASLAASVESRPSEFTSFAATKTVGSQNCGSTGRDQGWKEWEETLTRQHRERESAIRSVVCPPSAEGLPYLQSLTTTPQFTSMRHPTSQDPRHRLIQVKSEISASGGKLGPQPISVLSQFSWYGVGQPRPWPEPSGGVKS